MLRHYLGINPDALNDDEWYERIKELHLVIRIERDFFKADLREVLYELANKIYGG